MPILTPLILPYSPPRPDEVVTISVKDCGAGLSPEDLGRLFQEGVQINPNKLQVHPCLTILFYHPCLTIYSYLNILLYCNLI